MEGGGRWGGGGGSASKGGWLNLPLEEKERVIVDWLFVRGQFVLFIQIYYLFKELCTLDFVMRVCSWGGGGLPGPCYIKKSGGTIKKKVVEREDVEDNSYETRTVLPVFSG